MKVVLLSTYRKGGAGIACERLKNALAGTGIDTQLLVQEPVQESETVKSISSSAITKFYSKIRLAKDVYRFALHEKSKEDRFQFSVAREGVDLSNHPLVKDADIIHLHWINQGFLSVESIKKLTQTGKPVVWTLHDMWAFTGGCHYSGGCPAYETECNYCPYLKDASPIDISNKVWKRKKELFASSNITFVTCSNWLKDIAASSRLLRNARIESIPNPIDTDLFKPLDKTLARKTWNLPLNKKLILFGAMNIQDKRKGFHYLVKALSVLAHKYPQTKEEVELIVFGKAKSDIGPLMYKTHFLNSLSSAEEIINAYSSADLFVTPSIQDNLPNTIMESMACGTPVVAFDTGGIPEMIDHLTNGYISKYKSAEDLAEGIYKILGKSTELAGPAREKVLNLYTQEAIAKKYTELYKDILGKNKGA